MDKLYSVVYELYLKVILKLFLWPYNKKIEF